MVVFGWHNFFISIMNGNFGLFEAFNHVRSSIYTDFQTRALIMNWLHASAEERPPLFMRYCRW